METFQQVKCHSWITQLVNSRDSKESFFLWYNINILWYLTTFPILQHTCKFFMSWHTKITIIILLSHGEIQRGISWERCELAVWAAFLEPRSELVMITDRVPQRADSWERDYHAGHLLGRALASTFVEWGRRKQVWAREKLNGPPKPSASPMGVLEVGGPSEVSWVAARGLGLSTWTLTSGRLWGTSEKRCDLEQSSHPLKRSDSWAPSSNCWGRKVFIPAGASRLHITESRQTVLCLSSQTCLHVQVPQQYQ